MARQPDIQYIQPYSYGNTARKLELLPKQHKPKYQLPEVQPQRKPKAETVFDPVSVVATLVAAVMLIALMVGLYNLVQEADRNRALTQYVQELNSEGAQLHMSYEAAYDMDQVAHRAGQMGLVYPEQVEHVSMPAVIPQETPEETITFADFFAELFAKAAH